VRRLFSVRKVRAGVADVHARSEARLARLTTEPIQSREDEWDYVYTFGVTHGLEAALRICDGSTAIETMEYMAKMLDEKAKSQ
jgi:hypothetical protein